MAEFAPSSLRSMEDSAAAESEKLQAIPARSGVGHPKLSSQLLVLFGPAGVLALRALLQHGWVEQTDFAAFYAAAKALRLGVPAASLVIGQPSLSPPTLSLALWPFTYLPLTAAFLAWTALGVVLLVAGVQQIRRAYFVSDRAILWLVFAQFVAPPCFIGWSMGQLTWVLFYCVTRAWLSPSLKRAGVWLAIAVAVKPPLALMALTLPWRVTAWTVGVGAALCALTLSVTGLGPWLEWWQLRDAVAWIERPYNISCAGLWARLQSPDGYNMAPGALAPWSWGVIALAVAPLFVIASISAAPK